MARDHNPAMPPSRFFLLTCRSPSTDFRLPLAEALRRDFEIYYIWLKRKPEVTYPDGHKETLSFSTLIAFLLSFKSDKHNIFFNSTNTSFPFITTFLRLIMPQSIWCLDMHDDLRYHYKGMRLLYTKAAIRLMQVCSHVIVHAAPTLKELFPSSYHLGNASHIMPLPHDYADKNAILILASLDDRFDFALLQETAAACAELEFHIHGQVSENDPRVKARLQNLQDQCSNIHYHGPYQSCDLPEVLQRYAVTFAPYRTGIDLTRYIDPLRFYHCLNAGLYLVSTAIPQAEFMRNNLTIIRSADEAAAALRKTASKSFTPVTWDQRAQKLIGILALFLIRNPRYNAAR